MTSAETGEQWQKVWEDEIVQGKRLYAIWGNARLVAARLYEADADRIIADHKAAAAAGLLQQERDDAVADLVGVIAEKAALKTAAGLLAGLLADLIDEMPACDKDESRDYCMTHHTRHCEVEAMIAKARAAIAAAEDAGL